MISGNAKNGFFAAIKQRMKATFYHMMILMLLLAGCTDQKPDPKPEDYRMMNLVIERSRPDTVSKYLRYFIDKYQLPVSPKNLANGQYYAASPKDDFGYTHEIRFSISDGNITDVSYDEYKNGHSKTDDKKYGDEMNEYQPGSAPSIVYPEYEKQFADKQNLLAMDAVTGATYSLYRLWFVASKAMDQGPVSGTVISSADRDKNLAKAAHEFQQNLNREYADPEHSPLMEEDLENFEGLDFYPVNTKLIYEVKLKRTPQAVPFMMKRTKDEVKYVKHGTVSFKFGGTMHTLSVYQNLDLIARMPEYKNHLFLPFTDLTNGEETYVGGRYLDLEIPGGDSLTVDFNRAYNPNCAYNKKYSCPIPPAENDLKMRVEAGVKKWKH